MQQQVTNPAAPPFPPRGTQIRKKEKCIIIILHSNMWRACIFPLLLLQQPSCGFVVHRAGCVSRLACQTTGRTTRLLAQKKRGNQGSSASNDEADIEVDMSVRPAAMISLVEDIREDEEDIREDDGDGEGEDDSEADIDSDIDVVDSIDDIMSEEGVGLGEEGSPHTTEDVKWKAEVTAIITESVAANELELHRIAWLGNRIEVIVIEQGSADDLIGPGVDVLKDTHRDLYNRLEARDGDLNVVERYEICVASPGIGQFLRSERDFVSFRGFPIAVKTKEEYKKKTLFEGSLVERDDEHVLLSLKGRIVKIPRDLIDTVSLPKSKFESTDTEMRKLR